METLKWWEIRVDCIVLKMRNSTIQVELWTIRIFLWIFGFTRVRDFIYYILQYCHLILQFFRFSRKVNSLHNDLNVTHFDWNFLWLSKVWEINFFYSKNSKIADSIWKFSICCNSFLLQKKISISCYTIQLMNQDIHKLPLT